MTFEPVTKYVPKVKPYAPFGGDVTIGVRRDTPVEILKAIYQAYLKANESPRYADLLKHNLGLQTSPPSVPGRATG